VSDRMPTVKELKPQEKRIHECLVILKKLTDEVGIPATNPSIRTLKKRMGEYWRDGKLQEDALPLFGYNRMIAYKLPKWAHQDVELTLRINNIVPRSYPADLQAEIDSALSMHPPPPSDPVAEVAAQTNNASQSDPSHPSPPV